MRRFLTIVITSIALAMLVHYAVVDLVNLWIRNGNQVSEGDRALASNTGVICFIVFASIGRSVIKPTNNKKS